MKTLCLDVNEHNQNNHGKGQFRNFIIGRELPALQDTYHTRCLRKAGRILKDCYHPAFRLFTLLPSGRRYRSIRSRTRRLENSFFPRGHQAAKWTLTHYRHFFTRHFTYTVTFKLLLVLHLHTVTSTYCLH